MDYIRSYTTSLKSEWKRIYDALLETVQSMGFWFAFFCTIYVILILKVITFTYFYNDLFFGIYSILVTTYILSRFLLAYFHKNVTIDSTYEPTVAFVVPAKNEEGNIAETIRRFAAVDYPLEKVEVIAINDGSTDRTLDRMQEVAEEIRDKVRRVKVINWEQNRGKRHGMHAGVIHAEHDIVIFIDSDSFIEPSCVRHLVKYFADAEVGAVSGHTDVHNRDTNLLTQMQAVRYYIAFTIYKAAESIFGTVTCCPGCCSAYRRSYLVPFIDDWLHQVFLGGECTFGDDRSLTNYIIRKYRACYSYEAKAYTVVPDNFRTYLRQQQRWKKSWVRETFIASKFMWKKNTLAAFSFYAYIFLAFLSPVVFFRAVLWHPIETNELPIIYMTGLFLMLLLHGLFYRVQVGRRAWFLAILTFWFNTVILIWQLPWAVVTIKDSRWGTR